MMYQNKLVTAIKVAGNVLREQGDTVFVPFGSEYSILIKNLNSVKALVNITIDGTDVVPGGLIVDGNREVNLERFVKDRDRGNRFKFIQRTGDIEEHRGVKADDGIIRISFKYERRATQFAPSQVYGTDWNSIKCGGSWGGGYNHDLNKWSGSTTDNSIDPSRIYGCVRGLSTSAVQQSAQSDCSAQLMNVSTDVGITAPGSVSDQKFQTASWFPTENEEHVIVMRLLGEAPSGKRIDKPVTVKHQPECSMCGRKNKATAKYCTNCGTSLELI